MSALANGSHTTPLEERIQDLEARLAKYEGGGSPRVRILHEPLTYEARLVRDRRDPTGFRAISTRERRSYIQDFCLASVSGDQAASERLQRHAQEMKVIGEEREHMFHPDAEYRMDPTLEMRTVSWTNGAGGYFAPPLWIIEQFAFQPTPERVLSKWAPSFELPEGAQSVTVPVENAGGEVGNAPVGAPAVSTSPLDQPGSSAVATIAGNYDVPMQMLEQSPQGAHLDWVAFTTMEARYAYQLELQMLVGTGAQNPQGSGNNQLYGIYNNAYIPAANQIQFTASNVEQAPTTSGGTGTQTGATTMFGWLGLAAAKVGQNRLLPPEAWMMTTSRAAWLGSSEDSQNRPLMIADDPSEPGVWDLIGYPVRQNNAIPRTSGTGGNEERIIILRPSDWLILESEPKTNVGPRRITGAGAAQERDVARGGAMGDALSGTLSVRLQLRRYVAAILRRPESVAYLYGSGMATGGGW